MNSENLNVLLEIASICCSVLFILGIAFQRIWAWFFGILASTLALILFFNIQLYAETYLNGFYVIMGFYGWHKWKVLQSQKKKIEKELPLKNHLYIITIGALTVVVTGYLFKQYTNAAYPYLDSFTSVFGIFATWLEAKKRMSCWYYWIVINGVSIYLYSIKDLKYYPLLAALFVCLSIWGLIKWSIINKQMKQNDFKFI
jgi:nicotinamide mononucleotide transporter